MAVLDFDRIEADGLRAICAEEWQEGPLLDFKRSFLRRMIEVVTSLLKDVSALAKTQEGGDLYLRNRGHQRNSKNHRTNHR